MVLPQRFEESLLHDTAFAPPAASPDAPPLAELIARSGVPEPGMRWAVRAEHVTLGAHAVAGVPQVAAAAVGCRAELTLRDGVWLVTDRGSDAIRVDGEPLTESTPLAPGSTIRCGELEAVFLPHDRWLGVEAAPTTPVESAPTPVEPPAAAVPRNPVMAHPPLFAAMPATAPRRMPLSLILTLVAVAAIAVAAFFILRSR